MRLVFVQNNADLYGSSRSLLRLTSRLVADGNVVLVILPYDGKLKLALEKARVSVKLLDSLAIAERTSLNARGITTLLGRILESTWKLIRIFKRFRPDIVHSNTSVILTPAFASWLSGLPHVWHVREFYTDFPTLWKVYRQFMSLAADKLICVSESVGAQFTERTRMKKVAVIHDGFPVQEFEPVEEYQIRHFRKENNLGEYNLVAVIGRIKLVRKGQECFVRAVELIAAKHADTRFLIIGSPFPGNEEHAQELLRLIERLGLGGRMMYIGEIDDIRAAYSAIEIIVLPSGMPEPFGGVVIEAMAFAKPVIGTNHGGTAEQIEDGVTGILVEPSKPELLAEALGTLLSNRQLRRQMGTNARERYLKMFEFERFYRRINDVYQSCLSSD